MVRLRVHPKAFILSLHKDRSVWLHQWDTWPIVFVTVHFLWPFFILIVEDNRVPIILNGFKKDLEQHLHLQGC